VVIPAFPSRWSSWTGGTGSSSPIEVSYLPVHLLPPEWRWPSDRRCFRRRRL